MQRVFLRKKSEEPQPALPSSHRTAAAGDGVSTSSDATAPSLDMEQGHGPGGTQGPIPIPTVGDGVSTSSNVTTPPVSMETH